jgi:Tfp pilus assembly protein PilF
VTHHAEAVRLRPDYHGAYFNLAFAYRKSGDKQKAFDTYQKLAAMNPAMAAKLQPLIK